MIFNKTTVIAWIAIGIFWSSCNNSQNKTVPHEHMQNTNSENTHACPMHPEIKGKEGDKCSKCGMELEAIRTHKKVDYRMKLNSSPSTIKANESTRLTLNFTGNGEEVQLEVAHEKKLHLMLVNDGLTWFRHIHPVEQEDGSYLVEEIFPEGGKYWVFADYKPMDDEHQLSKTEIVVSGNYDSSPNITTEQWVSNTDGYKLTIENANDYKTNRTQHINISVDKSGTSLSENDLEPYLGAAAHIVIISKNEKAFNHVHPIASKEFPIHGEVFFEFPGVYRVWVQFQTKGRVHTADFTINVAQGDSKGGEEKPHDHQH